MEIKHVGVVGLGRMGSAVASRIGSNGFDVTAYDRSASKVAAAKAAGARPACIPADAAEPADVVVVTMPDEIAAEEVLFDLGGIGETLREGGYVLDASATGPHFSRAATARLAKFGIVRIELSFESSAKLRSGRVRVLAGCAPADLAAVTPLLMLLADDIVHVGPVGSVATLRLASAAALAAPGKAVAEASEARYVPVPTMACS